MTRVKVFILKLKDPKVPVSSVIPVIGEVVFGSRESKFAKFKVKVKWYKRSIKGYKSRIVISLLSG